MKFRSTQRDDVEFGLKDAVLQSIPPGGGLFVPKEIPHLDPSAIVDFSLQEMAFFILKPFVKEDLSADQLADIIRSTFSFEIPILEIGKTGIYAMELFHGPTWAFKDIGARVLAGCLSTWASVEKQVVLVATSGDTGGAVAAAFHRVPGVDVVILYPEGKISDLQHQQISGYGDNVHALAVMGHFDDCQSMVRQAFGDDKLKSTINLVSANSINIARWLPQMVYYGLAHQFLSKNVDDKAVCVPSGNYGNITAAVMLHLCGFRFDNFIAAHNANDTVSRFLATGHYLPRDTIPTVANAMDVSDPNNFSRLIHFSKRDNHLLASKLEAVSFSDEDILAGIRDCWEEHNYLCDPHTATAWLAMSGKKKKGILAATAHPQKFEDVITRAIGYYPDEHRKDWIGNKTYQQSIQPDLGALKDFLIKGLFQ